MNILIFVAGVLDPKWPIAPDNQSLPQRAPDRQIFSPFDEAALEIALRIRDALPGTKLTAIVAGGENATKLARAVAALNITDVATLSLSAPWDQAATARELAAQCQGEIDLVLIGREFGDCDDGLVPPLLAGLLNHAFFGRVQCVDTTDKTADIRLMRENGASEERLSLSSPVVASVTNDRRTRLRKPLMKNVMAARGATIRTIACDVMNAKGLLLGTVRELAGTRSPVDCTFIEGPLETQADRLADLLLKVQP